jgi:hypothetical protein
MNVQLEVRAGKLHAVFDQKAYRDLYPSWLCWK